MTGIVIIEVLGMIINLLVMLVIVQFVLGLLISFNVVNMQNQFVEGVFRGINALLDPILRPIRRILPDTGMIDFSPLVLIFGLTIVYRVLALTL